MSKAFTKESDREESEADEVEALPVNGKNYVTPAGLAALQDDGREDGHVIMTGPATQSFEGRFDIDLLAAP